MFFRMKLNAIMTCVLMLLISCSSNELLITPGMPTSTSPRITETAAPLLATTTPILPTITLIPPTASPSSTATNLPPTTEPQPTAIASVDKVLDSLKTLTFETFLNESYRQLKLRDPDNLIENGYSDLFGLKLSDSFTNISLQYKDQTQQVESELLPILDSYDRESLSYEQQISYDAYHWYLEMLGRGHAYANNKFLINPVWGLQDFPVDLLLELPLQTKEDAEKYVARLANISPWMDQVIERLSLSAAAGALPPKYVIEDTVTQIDSLLSRAGNNPPIPTKIELYSHFHLKVKLVEGLSAEERAALDDAALEAIEAYMIPAYTSLQEKLLAFSDVAVEDPDQWRLPGGKAYYDYLLEYYTGTNLSAAEIHTLALKEVARLQSEIQSAATDLGYPGDISMPELNQRIFEESSIITGNALLKRYEQILTAADQRMEDYFDRQSSVGVVIKKQSDGPPAYYQLPAPGSNELGVMPVNPDVHPLYVNYNEYVLTHHETIPGHHTQLSLAQELDVPDLQRYYIDNPYMQEYILQAFVEGWAVYAETLAWEMGLYEEAPLANLGRLRLQLLRTVRAVVDTGIHHKGWTLDQAADYLEETTGVVQTRSQLTRYLVNPGYATGYNLGVWKIKEMRQRAESRLGDSFDIREFHNTILEHGILPIHVLDRVVDDWIESQLRQ